MKELENIKCLADRKFYSVVANAKVICLFDSSLDEISDGFTPTQKQITESLDEAKQRCDLLRTMFPDMNYEICEVMFSHVSHNGPSLEDM